MIYLSQRDPRWSNKCLGNSTLTVGRYGCTTTCISMASDYFKCYQSPLEMASKSSNYTRDGLVIWQNLRFSKMKFVRRYYGEQTAVIDEHLRHPDKAVILQVDNKAHWVIALRKNLIGKDYVCLDPWDGKKKDVKKAYKNITGFATFERI